MQLAGRTPAMCAMQCMTVDALAGSQRMIAGLGVSGPQIVEGWYGQPWGKPYWRLRDYVQIMRKIFRREGPVATRAGRSPCPTPARAPSGLGKPLRSILHADPGLPIWLGSGAEAHGQAHRRAVRRLAAAALLARPHGPLPALGRGGLRPGPPGRRRPGLAQLRDPGPAPVRVTDDVADALRRQKPEIALYVGGMGHPTMNFHNQHMQADGLPARPRPRIQELFLAGRKDEAAAAVPDEYVDERCLVGPPERIRSRYVAWAESGITGRQRGHRPAGRGRADGRAGPGGARRRHGAAHVVDAGTEAGQGRALPRVVEGDLDRLADVHGLGVAVDDVRHQPRPLLQLDVGQHERPGVAVGALAPAGDRAAVDDATARRLEPRGLQRPAGGADRAGVPDHGPAPRGVAALEQQAALGGGVPERLVLEVRLRRDVRQCGSSGCHVRRPPCPG